MSICLTEDELIELTGKVQHAAQRRQLEALGIDYRERLDGSLVVLRSSIEPAAGRTAPRHRSEPEPDLRGL